MRARPSFPPPPPDQYEKRSVGRLSDDRNDPGWMGERRTAERGIEGLVKRTLSHPCACVLGPFSRLSRLSRLSQNRSPSGPGGQAGRPSPERLHAHETASPLCARACACVSEFNPRRTDDIETLRVVHAKQVDVRVEPLRRVAPAAPRSRRRSKTRIGCDRKQIVLQISISIRCGAIPHLSIWDCGIGLMRPHSPNAPRQVTLS